MAVLFTDTDCEIWYEWAEKHKLNIIGMPYFVDGVESVFDLGKNASQLPAFFEAMRNGSNPKTAAVNQAEYVELFEPFFKKGEDILYISFSHQLSGTFQFMEAAVKELKEKYPNVRFERVDSLSISAGGGMIVDLGAKFFYENGCDIDKTIAYVEKIRMNIATYFVVDDLKYLVRGGRLSAGKAAFGTLMHVKPVLKINDEGSLDVFSKQSGQRKAISFLVSEVVSKYAEIDGGYIILLYADSIDDIADLKERLQTELPNVKIWTQPIGPVIGAHAGPGTIGVVFPSNNR